MNFLNPLFFAGLFTLAIPVFIHLVRRERADKLYFSSLRFLRPIHQRTLKYLRLNNLLLMLLRMAALLLIVLAFARPFFRRWEPPAPKDRARLVAVIVDNSFSMGYKDVLERAKGKARETIDGLKPSDKAFVATLATRLDNPTQPSGDRTILKATVDKISLTPFATDYISGLSAADRLLSEDTEGREKVIFLISDFHKTGYRSDEEFALGAEVNLVPIDVSDAGAENLAVTQADFVKEPQGGENGNINVRVVNFSGKSRPVNLRLAINGKEVGRKDLKVDRESAQGATFEKIALSPGTTRGRVELLDDDLKLDNTYYFTMDTDRKVKVLMVTRARAGRRDLLFAERALSIGAYPQHALTVKTDNEVKAGDFGAYDLVVLNEIDSLPAEHVKSLRSSLEHGKGVLFALGDIDPARFNTTFAGIAPARLATEKFIRRQDREPRLLTYVRTDHPIFRPFAERHSGNFAASVFMAIAAVEPRPDASVLAKFDDGSPALLEAKVGKGVSLLYSSTLGDRWNNLPLNPVYLPLLHQIVRHAAGNAQERNAYWIGEAIPLERIVPVVVDDMISDKITVLDPEGNKVRTAGAVFYADKPGFYEVKSERTIKYVAVNPNPQESDLRPMDVKEFAAAVTRAGGKTEAAATDTRENEAALKEAQEKKQSLWLYTLAAALLLLAGETFLANRMPRPTLGVDTANRKR